ncbi:uncharacterized protein LOC110810646 isoform X1 [Carica papaya]|uniref:uncharacterized protein LOC110810646 isoform X1 n=1 Tax=Carica papaya TaxID=3649 RepID=UPI000B8CCE2A|nr:uncharacterized protein LOC110810646 isoform X1 [Carica papaya]
MNEGVENVDDIMHTRKGEGIPDLEDGEDKSSFHDKEESQDSDDEFDEPSTDTLVRSFENFNRMHDQNGVTASHTMQSAGSLTPEKEFLKEEKSSSPMLSPVRPTTSAVSVHVDMNKMPVKEDSVENKIAPKDFFSSMKDIESLFIKASESGKEVPRMLEANKLHFRPIFPGKERGSAASTFFKACFACGGEDHSQVQEEPAQTDVKYLTWQRTESSRSSSSRNPLGLNSDDIGELNNSLFDSIYMISGSHASTLDRLYAWERKLYDEVKASETVRSMYDAKCKFLRQLESKGESSYRIDKTRASVKDLHSRIIVAIHRINSISNKIEELRDQELQPQLEELIKGLSRMWEVMLECHRLQYGIISVAYRNNTIKIPVHSESHRQITIHLENELSLLSSSFTKWIGAQKSYLQAINTWLLICVSLPQKSSRRKKRATVPSWRNYGPPIYATCGVWLDSLEKLPTRAVADSIKGLAAETAHFLPRQEKNQGKGTNQPYSNTETGSAANMLNNEASDDWNLGLDRFRSSLEGFLGQLNNFADCSVTMYAELERAIEDAKSKYDKRKSQSGVRYG